MKRLGLTVVCAAVALVISASSASAIPPFGVEFGKKYADNTAVVEAAKEAKCNVCHAGTKKTDRNVYGMALSELLDKKEDAKNPEKIQEALEKVAGMKAPNSEKTFGELIAAGKLPGAE